MMTGRSVINDTGIGDLSGLSVAELMGLWKRHLTERVPDRLPRSLLAALLAYRLASRAARRTAPRRQLPISR